MPYNRREAVEAKHLETQLMKPPTAFEAEIQSDVESDAEFRSWSEELQKELPANGGGGEDTISGLEGWLASADCCEGVFCVCAEKADAEFRSWSEELQKELPANGGGGEETSQEEAFRLCREDAARFKDVEFFKADAAADRSLFLNTAWLALARSAGLEEWLACARSEELFCECCLR
jgi:hypothetical protein